MHHPRSKTREFIVRTAVYLLMTTVTALVALGTWLYTAGYRFDPNERTVELSGLVQFITSPADGIVEVDGKALAIKTPTKKSVRPGQHEFVMWREGYETWRKELVIESGTLTWLNYTRFVPKARTPESVAGIKRLSGAVASPDRRTMAVIQNAAVAEIQLYQLDARVAQTTITLPKDSYTAATSHRFTLKEWSGNSRHLLIEHHGKTLEWLVVDRQDGNKVQNITKALDVAIREVQFANSNGTALFAQLDGDVRRIDIAGRTLSAPLARDVVSFDVRGETITYVTKKQAAGVVQPGKEASLLFTPPAKTKQTTRIDIARYYGQDFAAVSYGTTVSIYAGTLPDSPAQVANMKKVGSFEVATPTQWLQIGPSGRFIVAQSGAQFVTYDLERAEQSPVAVVAGKTAPSKLRWLDDYYVWSDRSNVLTTREFDGANEHDLHAIVPNLDVVLSPDGRYIYSFGRTSDGYQLQRLKMILE